MGKFKYATGLWALGGAADRFLPSGYSDKSATLRELVEIAGSVDGIEGVEIMSSQVVGMNLKEFKKWLADGGLALTSVLANTFGDKKFKLGSITNTDKKIRRDALDLCRKSVDDAAEMGCPAVCLWLGSDGFDYAFETDYIAHWNMLKESIVEVAGHNKKMKICIEYKLKEPRSYMSIGSAAKALYIAMECGDNVGVTIDFGHALMSKEMPGESVALLGMHKKLFNVHMNDAYGDWDDDLNAVTDHLQKTLEFMYYLEVVKYDGWIGLDIFPYRMDGKRAAQICVRNLRGVERMLDRMDRSALRAAMDALDASKSQEILSGAIFG
jgi:xylose isomerase